MQTDEAPLLLGRAPECQALDDLVNGVRGGQSGSLVLVGEAGIGKTALMDYAAGSCAGMRSATVVGLESETRLGFAALHRLLVPFLDRRDGLPGPQRDALGAAFGLVAGPPPNRLMVGLATLTLLAAVAAEQPLMCLVDDAHLLDIESLEVLAFVSRRLHIDGIGLLLSQRDTEDLKVLAGLPTLRVAGLPEAPARELVAQAVAGRVDPQVVSRILTETHGNPLALVELTRGLSTGQWGGAAQLPDVLPLGRRMEEHFLRQVRVMPDDTQDLLLVASVGPADSPNVVWRAATLLGLSPRAMDAAAGVLDTGRPLTFRHPLIRSAVYGGAAPQDRRRVHAALAAVIDRLDRPDRRAWHLAEATVGLDEDVAAELEHASDSARSRGGYCAQASFLARAAEFTPDSHDRARRQLSSAHAYLMAGDPRAAETQLELAGDIPHSPIMGAQMRRVRALMEGFYGNANAVPQMLLQAAATIDAVDPQLAWQMLCEALEGAFVSRRQVVGTTLAEVARAVVDVSRPAGGPADVAELMVSAFATRITGGPVAGTPLLRAAMQLLVTEPLQERPMALSVLGCSASFDLWDDDAGLALLRRLDSFDREHGALHALCATLHYQASYAVLGGRFADAEVYYAEATGIAEAVSHYSYTAMQRVILLAWQGKVDQTRAATRPLIGPGGDPTMLGGVVSEAHLQLAVLEASLGRYPEALELARVVYDEDCPGTGSLVLPEIIEAAVRTGDLNLAREALSRLAERANLSGTPWVLGLLARSRALAAGDEPSAEEHFLQAVEQLARSSIRAELARAHLLYGEWLRRQRRRVDARSQLRISYDMFAAMGAEVFAERARLELVATGERASKRTTTAGQHTLTPQEARVASLAASGATNVEIATRLFVTTSTVEYHMSRVFRKLAITSRRQLADRIAVELSG